MVKMKQVTLLGRLKDADIILKTVQKAGLMHLVPFNKSKKTEFNNGSLDQDIINLKKSSDVLRAIQIKHYPTMPRLKINLNEIVNIVLKSYEYKHKLLKEIEVIELNLKHLKPWGNFNPNDITILENNGVRTSLYVFEKKNWQETNKEKLIFSIINEDIKHVYVAIFNIGKQKLSVIPIVLPNNSKDKLCKLRIVIKQKIEKIEKKIASFHYAKKDIQKKLIDLLNQKRFELAKSQTLKFEDYLFGINGFIPANEEINFCNKLHNQVITIKIEDPKDEDEVPVKLKNKVIVISNTPTPQLNSLGGL